MKIRLSSEQTKKFKECFVDDAKRLASERKNILKEHNNEKSA